MQQYDLNIQVLDSILTANPSQQVIAQYTEWHQNLDPSYKYVRHMLEEYLTANQFKMLKISAQTLVLFFGRISAFKLPRTFYRAFLSIIQENIKIIEDSIKLEDMARTWKTISIDILEQYLNAFSIELEGNITDKKMKVSIDKKRIEERLNEIIEGKDYDSAIKLIQLIKYPQKHLEILFAHMVNNKQASKAANYIKTHKLDSKQFPLINKKLNKNMIRYFLNSVGWDAAQQIFEGQAEALWNLIQDLLYKKKIEEAKSVWWRNRQILQSQTKGLSKQILSVLNEWRLQSAENTKASLIENPYFDDYFGPSDKEKYLSLHQLGVNQEQIYFLSNTSKQELIDRFAHDLEIAKQIAIDTESIVGKTKLDKQKDEAPSIMQVAFNHSVYIIDCSSIHIKVKESMLKYLSSDNLLLGHALQNDLDAILVGLGIYSKEQRRLFRFGNVVDTCKLFKAIYPNERHCNLAFISLKVLGRQICKKQTLTNWSRRPLRRSQIHYAALDALAVIHIYHKIENEVGSNMLSYFLEEM